MNTRLFSHLSAIIFSIFACYSAQAITIDELSPASTQSLDVTSPASVATETDSTSAIGNHRVIVVSSIASSVPGGINAVNKIEVDVRPSFASPPHFSISQANGVKAITSIIWDKTLYTGTINYAGLGGINLLADGSTKFIISNFSFDFPNATPCTLEMVVYDASSPTGDKASSAQIVISGGRAGSTESFDFSTFTVAAGASAPADFTNVGAIVLHIKPDFAADISFDVLATDGTCTGVPTKNYVVDDCGVCNGDNTICADCKGVPNGTDLPGVGCSTGTPGACTSGKFAVDCSCQSITPASVEICDSVDNDCNGLVDENAICTKALTKDNPCVQEVKTDYYSRIRKDYELQYATVLDYGSRLVGRPMFNKKATAILNKNKQLLASSKKLTTRLPNKEIVPNSACINIACAGVNYKKNLTSLAANSRTWYRLTQQLIEMMKQSKAGGVCEGDTYYCKIRVQLRLQEYRRTLNRMKTFMDRHRSVSKKGPFTVNACSIK